MKNKRNWKKYEKTDKEEVEDVTVARNLETEGKIVMDLGISF